MEVNNRAGMQYKTTIKRFEYAVLYRVKDENRIAKAMKLQDEIRNKTKGGTDITKEIRKWRDARCS